MERQHLSPTTAARVHAGYGSISPVKQLKHLMGPHPRSPHRDYHQLGDLNDPQSGTPNAHAWTLTDGDRRFHLDRISRFLDHSAFGAAVDVLVAIVSLVFAGAYIANTYIPVNMLPHWLWVLELACALCFAVDFALRGLLLASHRVDFALSLWGLATIAAVLPVIPTSFFVPYHTLWYDASYWRFVYPLRFVKCYVDLKAVLARCHPLLSPVRQLAALCYLQLVLIIAGAAGVIQIAETSGGALTSTHVGEWTFFNSFFNSVLVFVTIGTPPADNTLARCSIGVLVVVLILIVPYQVVRVLDLGASFSPYERTVFKPARDGRHVVLCGDLTPSRIDLFFREVFHDDHDQADLTVVVLSEDEPAPSMRALLMDPFLDKRVRVVLGSLLDADDARRAAVASADAVFVLARRLAGEEDHARSDHRALLRILAAHRLMPLGIESGTAAEISTTATATATVTATATGTASPRVFAQLHLSQHRRLLRDLHGVRENALCFPEVIHSLLAQNCVCPGFSTFIYSLTATSSYDEDDREAIDADAASWEARYRRGSSHEVYSVRLPPAAVVAGRSFAEVASLVYAHCAGVIVFALVLPAAGGGERTLLNPGDSFVCRGGEPVVVIAQDRRGADAVTQLQPGRAMAPEWSSAPMQRQHAASAALQPPATTSGRVLASAPPASAPVAHTDRFEPVRVVVQPPVAAPSASAAPQRPGRRRSRFVNWQARPDEEMAASDDSRSLEAAGVEEEPSERLSDIREHRPRRRRARRTPEDAVVAHAREIPDSAAPIVLCVLSPSAFPNNLEYLIGPLRVRALRVRRPIVVLTTSLPDADAFAGFRRFRDVFFVLGDPFRQSALRRAGVDRAFRVVIVGGEGEVASEAGASELLEDASCIALHRTIVAFVGPRAAPRVITELVNRTNVHFISQSLAASEWFPGDEDGRSLAGESSRTMARDFFLSPAFAAGLAYSSSLCDSLLINQYFNPRITSILRAFIFASWRESEHEPDADADSDADSDSDEDADGDEVASDAGSISSPAEVPSSGPSSGPSPGPSPAAVYHQHQLQRCSMFAVEVPIDFVGKTFAFVFHYLLSSDGILALGLYRCRPDPALIGLASSGDVATGPAPRARIQLDESERSVPFGYVSVNPRSTDRISGNDLLYVLADKQPCWA